MSYPRKINGDEFYNFNFYLRDKNETEIYATDNAGNQFYLESKGYATKVDRVGERIPYFAIDRYGNPVAWKSLDVPKLSYMKYNKREIYPIRDGYEHYIIRENVCLYARDESGIMYYATDIHNNLYYAYKLYHGRRLEFEIDNFFLLDDDGEFIYPKNLTTGFPIYPKDHSGNDLYLKSYKGNDMYAKHTSNFEVYARDRFQNDVFAKDENGKPYYSQNDKSQIYPYKSTSEPFYLRLGDREIYAKINNGDEIYAANRKNIDILAKNGTHSSFYARLAGGKEIYPKSSFNEFYRVEDNVEKCALDGQYYYYAIDKYKNQIYPKSFTINLDI